MGVPLTFRLQVLSMRGLIFEEPVESVYLSGVEGEFELLAFHYPLMAALPEGDIKIAHHEKIAIKVGVVMFKDNECTILVELDPKCKVMKKSWME